MMDPFRLGTHKMLNLPKTYSMGGGKNFTHHIVIIIYLHGSIIISYHTSVTSPIDMTILTLLSVFDC